MLNGVIKTISLTPDKDNNLLIDVELPKGLETSYKKILFFNRKCQEQQTLSQKIYGL